MMAMVDDARHAAHLHAPSCGRNHSTSGVVCFHPATNDGLFFQQLWSFYVGTEETKLTRWMVEFTSRDKDLVLRRRDNYPVVLDRFCANVPLNALPAGARGVSGQGREGVSYGADGCSTSDPGFAEAGHFMLGSGLNCMLPARCLPRSWLRKYEAAFTARSVHVRKSDLFQRDVCAMPHVERNERGEVLLYLSYTFGLRVDLLLRHGLLAPWRRDGQLGPWRRDGAGGRRTNASHTTAIGSRSGRAAQKSAAMPELRGPLVLEIGGGWAGFAATLKRVVPSARYVLLDIPTTLPVAMHYLRRLGYANLLSLRRHATREEVHELICCTAFDFLFVSPHHLTMFPDGSVDVTVNSDSLVEMPVEAIDEYVTQTSRVSNAFLSVNRRYLKWDELKAALTERMLTKGWRLAHEAQSVALAQLPCDGKLGADLHACVLSAHVAMVPDYTEVLLLAPPAMPPARPQPGAHEDVRMLLRRWRLEAYTEAFEQKGYDDVDFLKRMDEPRLAALIADVGMKPGHAAKYRQALELDSRSAPLVLDQD